MHVTPGGFAFRVEGYQETGISQRIFMQGEIGEGGVTAEVRIGSLVQGERSEDIRFQVGDEEGTVDFGKVDAGVGYLGF